MSEGEPVPLTVDDVRPPQACAECGRMIDPYGHDVLHSIEGWAKRRRGGGVHGVSFKVETGRVMGPRCVRVRKESGSAQQGTFV
jgi:hypothetical protein